eukprot:2313416-Alexandrium_andersonii.AAC.1
MSASLVGSEMCIRDRDSVSFFSRSCRICRRSAPVGATETLPKGGPGVPVSYTHLTLPTICSV